MRYEGRSDWARGIAISAQLHKIVTFVFISKYGVEYLHKDLPIPTLSKTFGFLKRSHKKGQEVMTSMTELKDSRIDEDKTK